ncbi:MAG: M3 family oligoendopeptidase [Planctomycetes bacterium]|nr:M3 family oligoendopeptidase [Planctomycetota bacterium]
MSQPAVDCSPTAATQSFVPAGLNAADWNQLEPLYQQLITRTLRCENCLERLILDRSELDAAASEAEANLYIGMTCHTDNAAAKKAFLDFVEQVDPNLKRVGFELDKKIANSPHAKMLDKDRYGVLLRSVNQEVKLFREENVALQTEATKLDQNYSEISGAMMVNFDGEDRTLPQMARYLEETDRAKREASWRAVAERRLQDSAKIDEIYDKLIALRNQMGLNAGFKNFRDFQHQRMHRFDYTPEDCGRFQDAIEKHCVPLAREIQRNRAKALGLQSLRPWDLKVDIQGRAPLRPFTNADDLIAKTSRTYKNMDAGLSQMFDTMLGGGCLDLDSRKGKAPGGYQYQRQASRKPFIFMNAAGLFNDLVTMVHEAGHAFHSLLSKDDPILLYRGSPMEFAEVASMSQELLTLPYLKEFFNEADAARAKRDQLENRVITILPWIAQIDAFQHWVYLNPKHDAKAREAKWLELDARFGGIVDWTGLEKFRATLWQRQLHLFGIPFYYVEYGIAQLGALQVWLASLLDEKKAIANYKKGLTLGGSKPLPQLFEAAGIKFDFSSSMVEKLMGALGAELKKLPAN